MKGVKKVYDRMGLMEITTERQKSNGTIVYWDFKSSRSYIFRKKSPPRVQYYSNAMKRMNSYPLSKSSKDIRISINNQMLNAIPKIIDDRDQELEVLIKNVIKLGSLI